MTWVKLTDFITGPGWTYSLPLNYQTIFRVKHNISIYHLPGFYGLIAQAYLLPSFDPSLMGVKRLYPSKESSIFNFEPLPIEGERRLAIRGCMRRRYATVSYIAEVEYWQD